MERYPCTSPSLLPPPALSPWLVPTGKRLQLWLPKYFSSSGFTPWCPLSVELVQSLPRGQPRVQAAARSGAGQPQGSSYFWPAICPTAALETAPRQRNAAPLGGNCETEPGLESMRQHLLIPGHREGRRAAAVRPAAAMPGAAAPGRCCPLVAPSPPPRVPGGPRTMMDEGGVPVGRVLPGAVCREHPGAKGFWGAHPQAGAAPAPPGATQAPG